MRGHRHAGRDELGPQHVAELDGQRQFEVIGGMAGQLRDGWRAAGEALPARLDPPAAAGWNGAVICGMGGSAIGGDVVVATADGLRVPCEVVRGYALPAWVDTGTLVVAVSYSGDTEETLSCFEEACARGCRPVCVASGGTLAARASDLQLPRARLPGGMQPRSALGLLSATIAKVLEGAGLVGGYHTQIDETAALLAVMAEELAPPVPDGDNPAKRLARRLHGRTPVLYGAGVAAVAARRFKCELNEYADVHAFWAELPEMNHNEFVGWSGIDPATAGMHVVLLDDRGADRRLRRRLELTGELVAGRAAGLDVIESRGQSGLARLLSLAYLGDWTALYLALLNGVDPGPVAVIQWLKGRMADRQSPPPDAASARGAPAAGGAAPPADRGR